MAAQYLAFGWEVFGVPILLNRLSSFLQGRFGKAINYEIVQFGIWILTGLNCSQLDKRVNPGEARRLASMSLVKVIGMVTGVAAMRENAEGDQTAPLKWEFRTLILVNLFLYRCVLPNVFLWVDMAGPDEETVTPVLGQLFRLLVFLIPSRIYSLLGLYVAITCREHVRVLRTVLTQTSVNLRVSTTIAHLGWWPRSPMPGLLRRLEKVEEDWTSQRRVSLTEYTYLPLRARQIRLLKIHTWEPLTPIRCEIVTVSVDRAPPYEAISHAWETTTRCKDILVDDVYRLAVPDRIHRILRRRRTFVSSKLIWIDGLCIDQTNLNEKAQQVRMMGDIFGSASRVVVWLASPEEAPDGALLAHAALSITNNSRLGAQSDVLRLLLGDDHLPVMRKFFSNRWFSRVWMVQEVALPPKVHVVYGTACIDWELVETTAKVVLDPWVGGRMEDMLTTINDGSYLRRSRNIGNVGIMSLFRQRVADDRRRNQGESPFEIPANGPQLDIEILTRRLTIAMLGYAHLEDLLFATRDFESTDPRDKVFAILGMVLDPMATAHLPMPDYISGFQKTYHRAAAMLFETGKSPALVLVTAGVGLRRFEGLGTEEIPPSWVPDFRCPPGRLSAINIPEHLATPPGEDHLHIKIVPDSGCLDVAACFVDEILEVGPIHQDPRLYHNHVEGVSWLQAVGYTHSWLQTTRTMALRKCGQARAHETTLDDYWRALFLNRVTGPSGEKEISETEVIFVKERFEQICEKVMEGAYHEIERNDAMFVPLIRSLNLTSFGRRLCRTGFGRFAMAPPLVKNGDVVCFFKGSNAPWLLRPVSRMSGADAQRYQFVGSCFVHKLEYPRAEKGNDFRSVTLI